jgi:hypothetical protein
LAPRNNHTVQRVILFVAAAAIVTGLGLIIYLSYGAGLPATPDVTTGRTSEFNVHGTVLYATWLECWIPKILIFSGITTALLTRLLTTSR